MVMAILLAFLYKHEFRDDHFITHLIILPREHCQFVKSKSQIETSVHWIVSRSLAVRQYARTHPSKVSDFRRVVCTHNGAPRLTIYLKK